MCSANCQQFCRSDCLLSLLVQHWFISPKSLPAQSEVTCASNNAAGPDKTLVVGLTFKHRVTNNAFAAEPVSSNRVSDCHLTSALVSVTPEFRFSSAAAPDHRHTLVEVRVHPSLKFNFWPIHQPFFCLALPFPGTVLARCCSHIWLQHML